MAGWYQLLGSIQNCTLLYYTEGEKEYVWTHGFLNTVGKKSPDDLLFLLVIITPWDELWMAVKWCNVSKLIHTDTCVIYNMDPGPQNQT